MDTPSFRAATGLGAVLGARLQKVMRLQSRGHVLPLQETLDMVGDAEAENAGIQGIQAPTRTQTYYLPWTTRPTKYLENHTAHSSLLLSIHPPYIYLSIYPSIY